MISVGTQKEVEFNKVSRRSRTNEFDDVRCGAATTLDLHPELRGNKSLSDLIIGIIGCAKTSLLVKNKRYKIEHRRGVRGGTDNIKIMSPRGR